MGEKRNPFSIEIEGIFSKVKLENDIKSKLKEINESSKHNVKLGASITQTSIDNAVRTALKTVNDKDQYKVKMGANIGLTKSSVEAITKQLESIKGLKINVNVNTRNLSETSTLIDRIGNKVENIGSDNDLKLNNQVNRLNENLIKTGQILKTFRKDPTIGLKVKVNKNEFNDFKKEAKDVGSDKEWKLNLQAEKLQNNLIKAGQIIKSFRKNPVVKIKFKVDKSEIDSAVNQLKNIKKEYDIGIPSSRNSHKVDDNGKVRRTSKQDAGNINMTTFYYKRLNDISSEAFNIEKELLSASNDKFRQSLEKRLDCLRYYEDMTRRIMSDNGNYSFIKEIDLNEKNEKRAWQYEKASSKIEDKENKQEDSTNYVSRNKLEEFYLRQSRAIQQSKKEFEELNKGVTFDNLENELRQLTSSTEVTNLELLKFKFKIEDVKRELDKEISLNDFISKQTRAIEDLENISKKPELLEGLKDKLQNIAKSGELSKKEIEEFKQELLSISEAIKNDNKLDDFQFRQLRNIKKMRAEYDGLGKETQFDNLENELDKLIKKTDVGAKELEEFKFKIEDVKKNINNEIKLDKFINDYILKIEKLKKVYSDVANAGTFEGLEKGLSDLSKSSKITTKDIDKFKNEIRELEDTLKDQKTMKKFFDEQMLSINKLEKTYGVLNGDNLVFEDLKKELKELAKTTDITTDSLTRFKNKYNELQQQLKKEARELALGKNVTGDINLEQLKNPNKIRTTNSELEKTFKDIIGKDGKIKSIDASPIFKDGDLLRKINYSVKEGKNEWRDYALTMKLSGETGAISLHKLDKGMGKVESAGNKLKNSLVNNINHIVRNMFQVLSVYEMFYLALGKVKEGAGYMLELDKRQTNLSMVMGLNRKEVSEMTQEFNTLAKELGSTKLALMEQAEEWIRAGYNQEQTLKNLKASNIMATISGQEYGTATEQLIAILNGYNIDAQESMHVVDLLTTADSICATSTQELGTAISRTANSAQNAGVTLDTLVSYIASVSATTRRSAETIGESFKTLFARYQDIKLGKQFDEMNEPLSDVEGTLNSVGIAIRQDEKTFKSFSTVLSELSEKWSTLNQVDKSSIAKALGGTRQRDMLFALLDNMKDQKNGADAIYQQLAGSDGNSEKRNDFYLSSYQAKINEFKNSLQDLYNVIYQGDLLGKIITVGTRFINVLKNASKEGSILNNIFKSFSRCLDFLANGTKENIVQMGKMIGIFVLWVKYGRQLMKIFFNKNDAGVSIFSKVMDSFTNMKGPVNESVGIVGKLSTAFKLTGESAKGAIKNILKAQMANGIFVAISIAVGWLMDKLYKLKQRQDEFNATLRAGTSEAEKFKEAISSNDPEALNWANNESVVGKLQSEINSLKETYNLLYEARMKSKTPMKISEEEEETVKALKNKVKLAKEMGYVVGDLRESAKGGWAFENILNKDSGTIYDLGKSSLYSEMKERMTKVQKSTEDKANRNNKVLDEINQYEKLINSQKTDIETKREISKYAQLLGTHIEGLTIVQDENGNSIIQNTNLMEKEKETLKISNDEAIKAYEREKKEIKSLLELKKTEYKQKMDLQLKEIERLKKISGSEVGFFDNILNKVFGKKTKQQKAKEQLDREKKDLDTTQKLLDDLKKDSDEFLRELNTKYDPAITKQEEANKVAEDGNSTAGETVKLSELVAKSIEGITDKLKDLENQLKKIDLLLHKQELNTAHFNEGSKEYRDSLKKEIDLLKDKETVLKNTKQFSEEQAKNLSNAYGQQSSIAGFTGSDSAGGQAVQIASQYIGTPYVWGGTTPNGFDCSGLMQYVYKQMGIDLSRTTYTQVNEGIPVAKENLQQGDLVFFKDNSGDIHHVGMYAGNGNVLHAPQTGDVVKISPLDAFPDYYTSRRIIQPIKNSNTTSKPINVGGRKELLPYIQEASKTYGVSESLISAVIEAESGFNQGVTSEAGAIGLMQLMPNTASGLGVNPYNAKENVMGGTKLLSQLLKKYNGNIELTLAGYNAGEGNVEKYGGVPPFDETQKYIKKIQGILSNNGASGGTYTESGYMPTGKGDNKDALKDYEQAMKSLKGEADSLQDKAMDCERNLVDLIEGIIERNKRIYESYIIEFENKTKDVELKLKTLETEQKMLDKNSYDYSQNLLKIEENHREKIKILQAESSFIQKELKSNIYDAKTKFEMKNKINDITMSIKELNSTIKDVHFEVIQTKLNSLAQVVSDNIEQINNALSRLDSAKGTKDFSVELLLRQQIVNTNIQNVEKLTEMLKELNDEQSQTGATYLAEKIKQISEELDKANTSLAQSKKEFENVKSSIGSLVTSMEDKVKQVIQKQNELIKKSIEKNLKLFTDAIDKVKSEIEEAEKKLSNNETEYNENQKVIEVQEKLNRIENDDSLEAKAERAELEKQLNEALREQRAGQQNREISKRKDALEKAKEEYEKHMGKYSEKLDDGMENDQLTIQAKMALINGYFLDVNGNMIDIQSSLLEYEDKFGQGLSSIGNKIKTEIVDNLNEVKNLLIEFGTLDITEMNLNKAIKTVYGTGIDLANARKILGVEGYNYVDTNLVDKNKIKPSQGDIVLGGTLNDRQDLNGAIDLSGSNRYDTQQALQVYKDLMDGKVEKKAGTIYGSGIDLINAKKWLSIFGYDFVDTSKKPVNSSDIGAGDFVVGGSGANGGVSGNVPNRLGGTDRYETEKAIKEQFYKLLNSTTEDYYSKIKVGNVYGNKVDLATAKKYLSKYGYKFVETDDLRNIQLTEEDVVVGGAIKGKDKVINSGASWLYGANRYETERKISSFSNRLNSLPVDHVGFANGGLVDFTGYTMVHGGDKPELMLNNGQATNLHNFIKNIPNLARNMAYQGLMKTNIIPTSYDGKNNSIQKNEESSNYYYNIELNIDGNINATEDEANKFAGAILNRLKHRG